MPEQQKTGSLEIPVEPVFCVYWNLSALSVTK
ncbi:hypothetical protein WSWS_00728 [Weissella soli]|nr:hypothetical protein WSWS_00728 [Weissella soli]